MKPLKPYIPPIIPDHITSFVLSDHWTPEQVMQIVELLNQMCEHLFAQYREPLADLIYRRELRASHRSNSNDPPF